MAPAKKARSGQHDRTQCNVGCAWARSLNSMGFTANRAQHQLEPSQPTFLAADVLFFLGGGTLENPVVQAQ